MITHTSRLASLLLFAVALPAHAAPGKVDICHNTGSGKVIQLSVASSAVAAHIANHGDTYPGTWYADADGDGYGTDASATVACVAPDGSTDTGGDPDDGDPTVYPGATDTCDGLDNDSDGDTDEDALEGASLLARVGSALVRFDASDGASDEISALSASSVDVTGINALTSDLLTGQTYALERISDQLVTVDVCSGEVEPVGALGYTNTCGLSFGPDGDLYGIDSGTDQLLRVDPATGAAEWVGDLGFNLKNCGLAYDCGTDTLYGLHIDPNNESWIFTIDASSGLASAVVTLDPTVYWSQAGLEVDVAGGTYYVTMLTGLYAVDALTGDATQLAATSAVDNLSWWSGTCE